MPTLKYQTNENAIGLCRVGQSAVALAGAEPSGAAVTGFWIYKSGSRRTTGLRARYALLRQADGPALPSGRQPYLFAKITVLTQAALTAIALGSTVTYEGSSWVVADKKSEG